MRLYCVEFDTEDHGTVRAWFSTKKEANKFYNTEGKKYCEGHEPSLKVIAYDFTNTKRGIQDLLNWIDLSGLDGAPKQLVGVDREVIKEWDDYPDHDIPVVQRIV